MSDILRLPYLMKFNLILIAPNLWRVNFVVMKDHSKKLLDSIHITKNPSNYDARDVERAMLYCEAYNDGYHAAQKRTVSVADLWLEAQDCEKAYDGIKCTALIFEGLYYDIIDGKPVKRQNQ